MKFFIEEIIFYLKGLDVYYTQRNVLNRDLKLMGLGAGELLRGILTSKHISLTVSVSISLRIVDDIENKVFFF